MARRSSIMVLLGSLLLLAGTPAAAQPGPAKEAAKAKKLIEWGWDEPDAKFMR